MVRKSAWLLTLIAALMMAPAGTAQVCGPDIDGNVADVYYESNVIFWQPRVELESLVLTVSAPCEEIVKTFSPKDEVFFDLKEVVREVDGQYSWELRAVPRVDEGVRRLLEEVRGTPDEDRVWWSLWQQGAIPAGPFVESESFSVVDGKIVDPASGEEKRAALSGGAAAVLSAASAGYQAAGAPAAPGDHLSAKDYVISDDLIVDGSACVGFDCVNGESFGYDTIRVKENNLRIGFDDTSSAASYPTNNWQIRANDSANGGASYLGFVDMGSSGTSTGGDLVFGVEAGAPAKALWIDDYGRAGFGTGTPYTEIHTVDGDTPTVRLQQDGSSGFAPQTWDVAGNETNFFIRDVTSGSTLPFRIAPGAPSSSLTIKNDGKVGIGTWSPGGDGLEIANDGSTTQRILLRLKNDGAPQSEFENSDSGVVWRFGQNSAGDFVINDTADLGTAEMRITASGQVYVNGGQVHPDYVFESDYSLMPVADLHKFVREHGHLPNVQSREERAREGGVNITELPLQLLEKVEELVLYTIRQEEKIDRQAMQLEALARQNAELAELVESLRSNLD